MKLAHTVLAAYTGTCGALWEVRCNDDSGPSCWGTEASVQFLGTAATTYFIMAAGYHWDSGNLHIVANSAPLSFGGWSMNHGTFQTTLNGPPGAKCVVEYSTDLQNWTVLGTYVIPPSGSLVVTDPDAGNHNQRYYRVRLE